MPRRGRDVETRFNSVRGAADRGAKLEIAPGGPAGSAAIDRAEEHPQWMTAIRSGALQHGRDASVAMRKESSAVISPQELCCMPEHAVACWGMQTRQRSTGGRWCGSVRAHRWPAEPGLSAGGPPARPEGRKDMRGARRAAASPQGSTVDILLWQRIGHAALQSIQSTCESCLAGDKSEPAMSAADGVAGRSRGCPRPSARGGLLSRWPSDVVWRTSRGAVRGDRASRTGRRAARQRRRSDARMPCQRPATPPRSAVGNVPCIRPRPSAVVLDVEGSAHLLASSRNRLRVDSRRASSIGGDAPSRGAEEAARTSILSAIGLEGEKAGSAGVQFAIPRVRRPR